MVSDFKTIKTVINEKTKSSTKPESKSLAFDFNPPTEKIKKYGELFIFIELPVNNSAIEFKEIIKRSGNAFYREIGIPCEKRFKTTLRSLNEFIKNDSNVVNMAILAIHEDLLFLSSIGNAETIIISNSGNYRYIQSDKEKIFSQITITRLREGDAFLTSSKNIIDFILSSTKQKDVILNNDMVIDSSKDIVQKMDLSILFINIVKTQINNNKQNNTQKSVKVSGPSKGKHMTIKFRNILHQIKKVSVKTVSAIFSKNNKARLSKFTTKTKTIWTDFWTKYINPNPKKAIIVVIVTILIITIIISFIF